METEWKFAVPADFDAPAALADAGWEVADQGERELRATYYDTHDDRLLACGHTLRHRLTDGLPPGEWTLKLSAGARRGALVRDELTVEAHGRRVPGELARLLPAVRRGADLGPVARLVTRRRWWRAVSPDRRSAVEVADDLVTSRVGRRKGPTFREVELELLSGTDAPVDAFVARGARPSSGGPKLAQVLGSPQPEPPTTVHELVSTVFDTALRGVAGHDPVIRLGHDPEGVHQARVAVRRIRSHLRLLAPVLHPGAVAALQDELRWLAAELGIVRDLDVLHEHLPAGAVRDAVAAQQHAAHAELLAMLDEPRYAALLVTLAAEPPLAAHVLPDDPAGPVLLAAVDHAWRRLRKAVVALPEQVTAHDLHEVRKRAKATRYALDLAVPVLARRRRVRAWIAQLADLQDLLGDLNDAAHAEHAITSLVGDAAHPALAFEAGRLVQAEVERQRRDIRRWPARWAALRKGRPRLLLR